MKLHLTLPLPPAALSPNARVHWRTFAKAKRLHRSSAKLACMAAGVRHGKDGWPVDRATIQATFYHATARKQDPDNLIAMMISATNGLIDGGVLTDDRDVTHLPPVQKKDKDDPRVELVITAIGGMNYIHIMQENQLMTTEDQLRKQSAKCDEARERYRLEMEKVYTMTESLEQHPYWYNYGCRCASCLSHLDLADIAN